MNTIALGADETERAGALLARGKLVVIPTETVYGLGGSARDKESVAAIFRAKKRPPDNPLIVHYSDIVQVEELVPRDGQDILPLIRRFMPGPLTVVLPAPAWAPVELTAGLDSMAVRIPAHEVTRAIIRSSGVPIAAPSANRSGRPSPTTFEMAWSEMEGRVSAIVDGGVCSIGIESTVVDIRTPGLLRILRPGHITAEDIRAETGRSISEEPEEHHRSPGTRFRHYRPNIPVVIVSSRLWDTALDEAHTLCSHVVARRIDDLLGFTGYAAQLYRLFWNAERAGAQCILLEDVAQEEAPGLHDRLHRAADHVYQQGSLSGFVGRK